MKDRRLSLALRKDCSSSYHGSIYLYYKWQVGIWMSKDRSGAKGFLEVIKGVEGFKVQGQRFGSVSEKGG